MKTFTCFGVLLFTFAAVSLAEAGGRLAKNETYCLQTSTWSGPLPLMCRYESLQQCVASKTEPGDACLLNPELSVR